MKRIICMGHFIALRHCDCNAVIKKAYKKAGKEELCHMVKGKGGHQFYPDDAWPVMKSIL